MQMFMYNEKENTLYINTDIIMCDTAGLSVREAIKARRKHFDLSMNERINLSKYKNEILKEIARHPNCELSEFTNL